ncbi:hypothetical protein, partial [Escherichia coli]|uniref:hypothetical protein n=1 Tax=Escherichia coli TaxID=562 RepID=UPI00200E9D74
LPTLLIGCLYSVGEQVWSEQDDSTVAAGGLHAGAGRHQHRGGPGGALRRGLLQDPAGEAGVLQSPRVQ